MPKEGSSARMSLFGFSYGRTAKTAKSEQQFNVESVSHSSPSETLRCGSSEYVYEVSVCRNPIPP